jgi:hypothetical protein
MKIFFQIKKHQNPEHKNYVFLIRKWPILHFKYIGRKYYEILLCLIYHSNFIEICTADA